MPNSNASIKNTFLSASILATANMGDAFLYAWLPSNHHLLGISAFWMGMFLSINRFARLFLNGWVAYYLSKWGLKPIIIIAITIAIITTFSYGYISSIFIWLIARILWGISFSTLRLANTVYALQYFKKGFALGLSKAVIELGPVIALITIPLLYQYFNRGFTFILIASLNFAGFLLVLFLPKVNTETFLKKDLVLSRPSSFNILVLINAFVTEGVLVIILGRLLQIQELTIVNGLAIVGLLLSYRRLSLVIFSPISGLLADKYGFEKVFIYTTVLTAAGLLTITSGATVLGIILAFTFSAMNAAIATGVAIGSGNAIIKEASDNATWRDLGSASGTIAGAFILTADNIQLHIISLFFLFVAGLLYHHRFQAKKFHQFASNLIKGRVHNIPQKIITMNTEIIEVLEKNKIKNTAKTNAKATGCCGGAPVNNEEACCKLDEDKKTEGESGCGCNSTPTTKTSTCC